MPARGGFPARKVPKAMAERKDHTPEDRPFLSRWSERKQRAALDAEDGRPDTDPEQIEGADAEAADEELAANQKAAEAIDIDSLGDKSDYSPFFKEGVPAKLKSAALQRLWRSNPVFANVDGLNDYDGDFTIPKTPIGVVKTAWKLGRGFLTDEDIAKKGETAPDPQTAETGDGDDEAVAEAVTSEPDPVSPVSVRLDSVSPVSVGPAPVGNHTEPDPASAPEPEIAAGETPGPQPAPGVGLRNRLDMAAFSGRDDD